MTDPERDPAEPDEPDTDDETHAPEGPREIVDAAAQELEVPADETGEG